MTAPAPPVRVAEVLRDPVHLLAFGFGSGLCPWAPGTFGTLVGVLAFVLLDALPIGWYLLAILALFALGCWVCGESSRRLGVQDHPGIVFDEIVGYLIAALPLLESGAAWNGWPGWIAAFVLFRAFDIAKPWPISVADRKLHGGFGIMFDDALAGFAAAVVLGLAMV